MVIKVAIESGFCFVASYNRSMLTLVPSFVEQIQKPSTIGFCTALLFHNYGTYF